MDDGGRSQQRTEKGTHMQSTRQQWYQYDNEVSE